MSRSGALGARWADLAGPAPAAALLGAQLVAAWAEPQRRYHTLRHLVSVLDHLDELAADAGGTPTRVARAAAWFHDAVYVPGDAGNEAASAAWAAGALPPLGWAALDAAEVARVVLLTADHRCDPGDADGAAVCDADLAVLGGVAEDYLAYAAAVRAEHPGLDDDAWRAGRSAVVHSLLDRERVFATAGGTRRWEAAARDNLADELAALSRPRPGR